MQSKHLAKGKIALQKKPPGPVRSRREDKARQVYKPSLAPALSWEQRSFGDSSSFFLPVCDCLGPSPRNKGILV
jgi:hypothetical protein